MGTALKELKSEPLIYRGCDCPHCQEIIRQQYRMQHWQEEKICRKK